MKEDMIHHATIHTSKWPIKVMLYEDKTPHTVANFITLATSWFYDNLTFHRVIEDFMVQAGCPLWTWTGGPWYQFDDEFHPTLRHSRPWILSMANSWPHTNWSQFFITHVETPRLDDKHTVFGTVIDQSDLETVNTIAQGDTIERIELFIDPLSLSEKATNFATQLQDYLNNIDK